MEDSEEKDWSFFPNDLLGPNEVEHKIVEKGKENERPSALSLEVCITDIPTEQPWNLIYTEIHATLEYDFSQLREIHMIPRT